MATLHTFIVLYPHGWQEVDATTRSAARASAGSEPILGVYTRNEWNEHRRAVRLSIPAVTGESREPTPWAVICLEHGQVFLTHADYERQLFEADDLWFCPRCGEAATWDDDNYDARTGS